MIERRSMTDWAGALLFALGVLVWPGAVAGGEAVAFADNGGLKMLYDNRMYPQAVADGESVFIVWRGEDGLPYLCRYDLKERTFSERQMILKGREDTIKAKKYRKDHHYAPVIWMDWEGHLHVLAGCHNSAGLHLISKEPRSAEEWTEGETPSEIMSYPKVHPIYKARTLVYFRHEGHLGAWQFRYSSDSGRSWYVPARTVVDLNGMPQDGQHAAHAGSYNTTLVSGDGTELHIAFIWKVEDPVFNERYQRMLTDHTQRYNLYYLKVHRPSGEAFNIDGEKITLPLRKRVADERCLVWDTEERVAAVGPSICLDGAGQPCFMLPVSGETPLDSHFYFVRRREGEWKKVRLCPTLHPFNASRLERLPDGEFRAFLVAGSGEKVVEEGMDEYGWGQRVEEWVSSESGTKWERRRDLTPVPGMRYQNPQFVATKDGGIVPGLLLFYGWKDAESAGTAYLWDGR